MPVDGSTVLYSPTATYHESVYVPTDATRSFSSRYNVPVQAALDNAAWGRAHAAVPMKLELQAAANMGFAWGIGPDTARFVYVGGARYGWLQADITDEGGLVWQIDIPATLKVTGVTAHVLGNDGGAGHGGVLPQSVPSLRLIRQPLDGSDSSEIASADDPSTAPQYDLYHTIQLSGLGEQFAADQCIVGISGEAGVGAVAECFKVIGVEVALGYVAI